jgi:hypothetical protein
MPSQDAKGENTGIFKVHKVEIKRGSGITTFTTVGPGKIPFKPVFIPAAAD